MGTIKASSLKLLHFSVSPRLDSIDRVKIYAKLTSSARSLGIAIEYSDHFLVTFIEEIESLLLKTTATWNTKRT